MNVLEGISAEQRAFWSSNGYLILPGFYSSEEIDSLDAVTEWLWREKPTSITVDHNVTFERKRFSDVSEPRDGNRLKLNDVYLLSETMRKTILDPRLVPILAGVLHDDPVLINTLTIDLGTTQGPHVDSLFMTPLSEDALIATWTALEDVAIDAGPLFYYPASHLLEPYLFSSGRQHVVVDEFDRWTTAIQNGMSARRIERETFLAKKGDVFIWHARLVHGGGEILNPMRTRKSLVAHFFTKTDCVYHDMPVRQIGNGYWLNRGQQAAPDVGDPVPIPPAPTEVDAYRRSSGSITMNVDYTVVQEGGRRIPPDELVSVNASNTLLIRGWAADLERRTVPREIVVGLGNGHLVRARSRIGRPDLVTALGSPAFEHAGFLAAISAADVRPGRNALTVYSLDPDGQTLHTGGRATIEVEVT